MAKRIQARGNGEICKPVTNLIADYLNDKLSPSVKVEFQQHMAICPDCAAFLNTYKKTLQLTQSFLKNLGTKKPTSTINRVQRSIKGRTQKSSSKR
jgi:anti-sigma factor RsiW